MFNNENTTTHVGNLVSQPLDLSQILATLTVEQCPLQNMALLAVNFAPDSSTDEETCFNAQVYQTKSLSYFQRLYEGECSHMALDLLSRCMKIDYWSRNYTTDNA